MRLEPALPLLLWCQLYVSTTGKPYASPVPRLELTIDPKVTITLILSLILPFLVGLAEEWDLCIVVQSVAKEEEEAKKEVCFHTDLQPCI